MIKRFFTKKSVALFIITTIIVGFFAFNSTLVNAETPASSESTNTTVSASTFYDVISDALYSSTVGVAKFVAGRTDATKFVTGTVEYIVNRFIELVLIPIVSFLLAVTGSILDIAVQYTIYGNGFSLLSNVITKTWTLIRDLLNISFIFILLYAAIEQIITGSAKKTVIVSVVISAILINFSLFFTRVLVDASNVVATALYNQVRTVTTEDQNSTLKKIVFTSSINKSTNDTKIPEIEVDLSGRIMDGLGLTTIYSDMSKIYTNNGTNEAANLITGYSGLVNSVVRLLLFCITTSVFLIFALLFIGRFITLVILMATSPIGFVGGTIPGVGEFSKQWKDSLRNQVLMAPLIMFFLLLTIRVSSILNARYSDSTIEKYFSFFIVAYLLLKSVSIAKKMSGEMGSFVDKISGMVNGIAFGAATGGTALVGRQIIGRGADMLSKSQLGTDIRNAAAKGGFVGGAMKFLDKGIKGTANSTFDVRNTEVGKNTLGYANELAGTNIISKKFMEAGGKYKEGTGYSGLVKQQQADALKYAKETEKENDTYKQRVVDRNPQLKQFYIDSKNKEIEKLSQEKTDLEQKLKDKNISEDEKKEIRIKIGKASAGISDAQKSIKDEDLIKANDVIKSVQGDLSNAENKINRYKEIEQRFNKINKLLNSNITEEMRKQLLEQRDAVAEEFIDLGQQQTALKETINKINKLGVSSELKTIEYSKANRKNIAENIRNTWFSLRSKGERVDIVSEIMRNKPKEKSPEDKRNDALIEQLKKLGDKKD